MSERLTDSSPPTLTQWFSARVQPPARPGVYQRRAHSIITHSYWDGAHWGFSADTAERAADPSVRRQPSLAQTLPWRGLAEQPGASSSS